MATIKHWRFLLVVSLLLSTAGGWAQGTIGAGFAADGSALATAAGFEPYLDLGNGNYQNKVSLAGSENVTVAMTIYPDTAVLGMGADILMVAFYTTPQNVAMNYMRQGLNWVQWDGRVGSLQSAERVTLASPLTAQVYSGSFASLPGQFKIHVGYRLDSGELFFSAASPIEFQVGGGNSPTNPGNDGLVAAINFLPNPNGFGFANYGNDEQSPNDLNAQDMIALFGQDKVCRSPTGPCILNAAARTWMEKQIKGMDGGHCEGMAVASLRFNRGLSFKGLTTPAEFQAGAGSVIELQKDAVRNYIAYYFVTQHLNTISETVRATHTPSMILDKIITSFQTNDTNNLYTLGIYKPDGSGGHSITPYRVEDKGNGLYWLYVYDNNYPNDTNPVVKFNKNDDSWIYEGATTKPGEPPSSYIGNAQTKTLDLTPMYIRDQTPFPCVFCPEVLAQLGARAAEPKYAEIFLTGEGRMLLSDSQGNKVGYDFDSGTLVNQISGAQQHFQRHGLGRDIPPIYTMPIGTDAYQITVGGLNNQAETNVDLVLSGPGYTMGFEGILLDPQEFLHMTISPDGKEMSFVASQDAETPAVFLSFDPADETSPSYVFHIGGVELEAGKTLHVSLDLAGGYVYFEDDDGNDDAYDLSVTRIDDNGEQTVSHAGIAVTAGDKARLGGFNTWDGSGAGLTTEVDDEGDGFQDEIPVAF